MVTRLSGPYSANVTEKICLGHGWQIFYHNSALLVRHNFYISFPSSSKWLNSLLLKLEKVLYLKKGKLGSLYSNIAFPAESGFSPRHLVQTVFLCSSE